MIGQIERLAKSDTAVVGGHRRPFPEGLQVGVAGTVNIVDMAGTEHRDVPVARGWNPLRISRLKLGGSADDIWAVW